MYTCCLYHKSELYLCVILIGHKDIKPRGVTDLYSIVKWMKFSEVVSGKAPNSKTVHPK